MKYSDRIILASNSEIRAKILRDAGLKFDIVSSGVDEDVIKKIAVDRGESIEKTAMGLAEAKCMAVAQLEAGFVIGSDQIMEFQGQAFDKPKDINEARDRLHVLQGASHRLVNAVAVARQGEIIWRHLETPTLYMRQLDMAEIDNYLEAAGPDVLHSVGAYKIEQLGAHLFERVEGDHYAILGLSLFPLLGLLRQEKVIAF